MCVIGTGIDLVDTVRFKAVLARWDRRFIRRMFLEGEQAYCDATAQPWMHYAARFAVKEAVAKSFATGIGSRLSWLDIEVLRDAATGAPSVGLSVRGDTLARERGVRRILISISHTDQHAIAQALLVGVCGKESS
ncbi:MAG: holo-ACP synthase [Kiritimatiellia bacterium]